MSVAKIEVFTSPTCPHCPHAMKAVDKFAKDRDIKVVESSTYNKKGHSRAREFGVRSVPTLFITSPGNPERIGYIGVPSQKQLNKMINLSLGIEEWEKPQSLWSRLKKIKL